jgi:hypothetical protein
VTGHEPDGKLSPDRSEWRWRVYPRAIVLTMLASVLFVALSAEDEATLPGTLGGDLPTFYAAGDIVRTGDGHELFDIERQFEAQAGFWEGERSVILYLYPPVFATPYTPLSALDYRAVYLIHSAVMVGALVLSVRLLGALLPWLGDATRQTAALAFALLFLPMFVGSLLGQTTALFVLALVAVWWGLANHRDVVAGIASGLLVIKPQYGVPVLGLVFLARRWTAFGTAVVTVALLWFGSVLISGPGWVADWWRVVRSLSEVDQGSNLSNEVSVLGVAEVLLGAGSAGAFAIWAVLSMAIVGAVLWRLQQHRKLDPVALALVPPMLLLIAPHSLYYDAGVLLLSLAVLVSLLEGRQRTWALGAWLAGGLTYPLHQWSNVQPVVLVVLGTFAWAWWASAPGREHHDVPPGVVAAES